MRGNYQIWEYKNIDRNVSRKELKALTKIVRIILNIKVNIKLFGEVKNIRKKSVHFEATQNFV